MTTGLSTVHTLPLRDGGASGAARRVALEAVSNHEAEATSLVGYRSAGYVLIIGSAVDGLECADRLRGQLHCTVLADAPAPGALSDEARAAERDEAHVTLVHGEPGELRGHLGRFSARLHTPNGEDLELAALTTSDHPYFDLVLDLRREPGLNMDLPPFGYYAPRGDPDALERALVELPEMTGEFEKPRFFNYSPDICAHGDSGLKGCTRCIDACPTDAIRSIGDLVEVDPYLCQGGGTCATACPTGAIIYAYPGPKDTLAAVRLMLGRYRDAGGERPVVLFHDSSHGLDQLRAGAAELPENVLPFAVEEIGSVGMDTWLATLAYGASRVELLDHQQVPPTVRGEMEAQLTFARSLLEGLGHDTGRLQMRYETLPDDAVGDVPDALPAASFETFNEKRGTLRLALDHLWTVSGGAQAVFDLPRGAPFGDVVVDSDACTLCMACPQVCPTRALTDAGDKPQLNFTEELCVQCGLCQTACPEDAITLQPRFVADWETRRQTRVLNEEEPFCCVSCGKPFGTPSTIERMLSRLEGHHMFETEEQRRRLKMCGDCRVKDMFEKEMNDA
ncbi:4Fe-4S binding protein [Aquisalimonas lutea]|uniref:4Fe-4S binding protein n=1 Tax=Aquisalimonas lutea TaxID=1327750 RepID=UPI0025B4B5AD|nr:4Fe-4S binding protein [Aquisalimonas lutea]MDN3519246.1 4Fe-4S binding protein [Aquisalimonas lutea]